MPTIEDLQQTEAHIAELEQKVATELDPAIATELAGWRERQRLIAAEVRDAENHAAQKTRVEALQKLASDREKLAARLPKDQDHIIALGEEIIAAMEKLRSKRIRLEDLEKRMQAEGIERVLDCPLPLTARTDFVTRLRGLWLHA